MLTSRKVRKRACYIYNYIIFIAITIYVWHINLKTKDHKEYLRLLDLTRYWQPWKKERVRDCTILNL